MNPADPDDRRAHAEAVARARLRKQGMDNGLTLPEAEAYADAMLPTAYGRGIVLDYHIGLLREQISASWLGRRLLTLVEWYDGRSRRG